MSHLVSRILLAVFLIPAAMFVYILTLVYFDTHHSFSDEMANLTAGVAAWVFIAVYWTLLWRGSVQWTHRRIVASLIAPLILAIVGAVFGIVAGLIFPNEQSMWTAVFGSTFTPIAWLIATVFLWRETAAERRARVSSSSAKAVTCPTCGYNLTGLTATRCPECGKQCTLDELFAAQASPVGEEIEPS